jgi:hypothetical protein
MKARPFRLVRRPLVGALATGLVIAAATSSVHAAPAPAPAPAATSTVTLQGEGSWDPYREMTTWQNDLFGTGNKALITLNYLDAGSQQARQDYLASGSSLDYIISGVGFQPNELKQLKNGAKDLIDAPVFVGTTGFLLVPPITAFANGGFGVLRTDKCDPNDPSTPDPTACTTYYPYNGPVRVPNFLLAAMGQQGPLFQWDNPNILRALQISLSQGTDFAPPQFEPTTIGANLGQPAAFLRSDPSESDYYLQLFGDLWANPKSTPTVTEQLPNVARQTRQGVLQQVQQLEVRQGTDPPGLIAPVQPSALSQFNTDEAAAHLENPPPPIPPPAEWIWMQNANGDWVQPTTASIDAAVAAGGDAPLYALTNKVPGAYPLAWIDHLYAPAHGLTVDKTEALATAIRYFATVGQGATKAQGDGQLSAPLVLQALNAANSLVSSNCTGPGRLIVQSSNPGVYAPPSMASASIGPMLHCTSGSPQSPKTPTSLTGGAAANGFTDNGSSLSGDNGIAAGGGTIGTSLSAGGASSGIGPGGVSSSRSLPSGASRHAGKRRGSGSGGGLVSGVTLPLPWGRGGLDRLTALVLGVGLFLLVRKRLDRWLRYLIR